MDDKLLYRYKAINANGQKRLGYLTAKNEVALARILKNLGLELITYRMHVPRFYDKFLTPKITLRDKLQFYIQMEQLIKAGITILNCFDNAITNSKNTTLSDKLLEMKAYIAEGLKFSEAMLQFPTLFSRLEVAIIKAGEESGKLGESFSYVIEYLKNEDMIRRKVKKALRYPTIVTCVIFIAIIILMGFVVPQIVTFLIAMDAGELPFLTKALIATSNFVKATWWMLLLGAFTLVATVVIMRKVSSDFNYKFDAAILKVPVMGELIRKIEISRFCYVFSVLYSAGIPVLSIMRQAKQVCGNAVIRTSLENAAVSVKNGAVISQSLNDTKQFPSLVIQMFVVGEESGKIEPILIQISEYYNNDVDDTIEAFVSMIEPGLTVIMGLVIVWIAVAVFGPIYSMFEKFSM